MKKYILILPTILLSLDLFAPPNCEIYRGNDDCYKACQLAIKAIYRPQGSYASQQYFDQSIESCDQIAYAFMEKGVPFLKRGLFIEWKKLIDQAVALDPLEYLGYRAWCRVQFLRDYQGAITDLELLKQSTDYDIGYCQTGRYHLDIVLALCYKEMGDLDKARTLMTATLSREDYFVEAYDYYHFGVLEYEAGNYEEAIQFFQKQIDNNDSFGELYYFKALAYKQLKKIEYYKQSLEKAEAYYKEGKYLTDSYTEPLDKIYLADILDERKRANEY